MDIADIILIVTYSLAAGILIGAHVFPKTKSTRLSYLIRERDFRPDPPKICSELKEDRFKTFQELTAELKEKRERAEADLKIAIARKTISEIYELMAKKRPNERPNTTSGGCCQPKKDNTTAPPRKENKAVCGTCFEAISCKCAEKVFVNWPDVDERIKKAVSLAQEAIEIAQRGGHPERLNYEFNYRK